MKFQIFAAGIAGILIGFILGFFTARGMVEETASPESGEEAGLPANHPGIDVMERVQGLLTRAEAEPENSSIRVELGNTFYDMGRYDVAVKWYREALALDPDQPLVSTDLGTSLLFLGRTDEAIDQYRSSLQSRPGHPQTLQNLGVALFAQEKYREAIDNWRKLLETNPDYADAAKVREQITAAEEKLNGREDDPN